jgi:hypothetical protein
MSVLSNLLARIQPVVTIEAQADDIIFRRRGIEVRQPPLIRVADDGRIIEVGRAAAVAEGGRLIRLFDAKNPDANLNELQVFCRSQLRLLFSAFTLRPRVMILESSIRKAFGAHAVAALDNVLRDDRLSTEIVVAT